MTAVKCRAFAFNLAIVLLSTSVSFILAELAIRVFDIGPEISPVWAGNYILSENPTLGYELKPLSKDGAFIINNDGMRDTDYSIQKSPNTFRILVIGDSITYGFGVEQSETFSSQLERLLNTYFSEHSGRKFEVLNLGVSGYNFTQNVENLRVRGLKYDPDLVLYAYCLNDPQEYSIDMASLLAEMTEARQTYARALEEAKGLLEHSRVFLLTRYLIHSTLQGKDHPTWDKDDPQFVAILNGTYQEYFTSIHRSAKRWNHVLAGLNYLGDLSKARKLPIHMIIVPILLDLGEYNLHQIHDQLRDAFAVRGLYTFDLYDSYVLYQKKTHESIGSDSLHPNAAGHEFTAVAILYHLLQSNSIPNLTAADFLRLIHGSEPEAGYAQLLGRGSLAEIRE